MKTTKLLLFLIFLGKCISTFGQQININQIQPDQLIMLGDKKITLEDAKKISPDSILAIQSEGPSTYLTRKYGKQAKYGIVFIILKPIVNDINVPAITMAADSTYAIIDGDTAYRRPDKEAEFPGGTPQWAHFLTHNLNSIVPANNGAPPYIYKTMVSMLIDETGKVLKIWVLKKDNPGFGIAEESIRVLKLSPSWIPAIKNGKPVKSIKTQPFVFQVSEE